MTKNEVHEKHNDDDVKKLELDLSELAFEEISQSSIASLRKTPWHAIYACGLTSMLQTAQTFIYFNSIWPYLKTRDPEMSESVVGYIFGAFNISRCFSTILFGYLYNRLGQVRLPLLIGFFLASLGNFMYILVDLLPVTVIEPTMLTAWVIFGVGTGNSALLRTFAVTAANEEDRTKSVSIVEIGMAIGSIIGTGLQLLVSPLGNDGVLLYFYRLNIYTAPAILAFLFSILGIFVITFAFKERSRNSVKPTGNKSEQSIEKLSLIPLDKIAVGICIATRVSQILSYSTLETLLSPYSMLMWSYTEEEAVKHNSTVMLACETLGVILLTLFVLCKTCKITNERLACFICTAVTLFMFVATYSYSFLPTTVQLTNETNRQGCDTSRYSWCDELTSVNPIVFYTLFSIVFGPIYDVISVTLVTLFASIAGPRKQGTLQTILQLSGYIGKSFAPFLTTYLYTSNGPRMVWGAQIGSMVILIAFWIIFYKRLGKKA